jgi:hypothetical protein
MGRRYSLDPIADLVTGSAEHEDEELRERPDLQLTPRRLEALDRWAKDPWDFLTGTDPDTNQPIIRTQDQRDKKQPIKAYPSHLAYCHEQYVQIEKASQMIVTTNIALWAFWRTVFRQAHKTLLSKHKEEEASTILAEKIRIPWNLMPEWLRLALPITLKPANKITASKTQGIILGLPENAAAADARGQTYNVGLVDEAEFQDNLPAILTAMFPRAGQVIFWSTPSTGGEGARVFRSYLNDDPIKPHPRLLELRKKYVAVKGMTIRRNEDKNVTILRIEHTADPAKRSKEWEIAAAKPYPSMADFRREMKIDRSSMAGRPFYPAFAENQRRYIQRAPGLLDAPIIRGWDFGGRNPACVWGQWSKRSRRFWVLREILGKDIDTFAFRDVVKFLSGQMAYDSLVAHNAPNGANRAYELLKSLELDKAYPTTPWFEGNLAYVDFAGHEAVRPGPGLTKVGEPKVAAEVLAAGDIYVLPQYTFQRSRTQVINGLARLRNDGMPGIMLDPACPILIKGLCGEIVYAKGTASNPDPNEPVKDSIYSHLHEALGYALVNTVALDHADYFATTADGQLPEAELDEEESEVMDSYLTGEGL